MVFGQVLFVTIFNVVCLFLIAKFYLDDVKHAFIRAAITGIIHSLMGLAVIFLIGNTNSLSSQLFKRITVYLTVIPTIFIIRFVFQTSWKQALWIALCSGIIFESRAIFQ